MSAMITPVPGHQSWYQDTMIDVTRGWQDVCFEFLTTHVVSGGLECFSPQNFIFYDCCQLVPDVGFYCLIDF